MDGAIEAADTFPAWSSPDPADLITRLSHVAFRLAAAASLAQGPAVGRLHDAIRDLDAIIADVRRDSL